MSALVATAACAPAAEPAQVVPEPTEIQEPTPDRTVQPPIAPSAEESQSFGDASSDESPGPPVLNEQASERPLGTADFFSSQGDWRDDRYSVADLADVSGVGSEEGECGEGWGNSIELRLANLFSQLDMTIGQSNKSASSDMILVVNLSGNGTYIDSRRVPFNEIQEISVDVVDVNALEIRTWLEPRNEDARCGSVEVVLSDISVS